MRKFLQITILSIVLIGASGTINADGKQLPPPNPDPNTSSEHDGEY
ncbi:hypothetical protein [Filobacillus milosensis]|nr:hypothetical protein [Filobacillus milosensis]